jgi:hypothetical protein
LKKQEAVAKKKRKTAEKKANKQKAVAQAAALLKAQQTLTVAEEDAGKEEGGGTMTEGQDRRLSHTDGAETDATQGSKAASEESMTSTGGVHEEENGELDTGTSTAAPPNKEDAEGRTDRDAVDDTGEAGGAEAGYEEKKDEEKDYQFWRYRCIGHFNRPRRTPCKT